MTQNKTSENTDDRLREGTIIDGRYEIVGHLGRGGFAHVYKAKHIHLDREMALKILEIPSGPSAQQFRARFLQEARIAAKIKHPNVVDVFDFGVANDLGQPYLAMDYLAGHDLEEELVRNGPMEPARAIRLFIDTLSALAEGHRLGIVHKDLKPSNLYLSSPGQDDERLIILDFGIARVSGEASSQMTQTGSFTGTPAYLAPEYIESQVVTPALDVYQMGLIFIESLTAIPAVSAGNSMAYLLAHCQGLVNIPPELEATDLGAILKKATLLDPKMRYPSAVEFCAALKGVQAPTLPFVGMRTMPLGFGNRGRLDSINVLAETSDNTPVLPFVSEVMPIPRSTAPSLPLPVDPPARFNLGSVLGVLVGLVLLGMGAIAIFIFGAEPNEPPLAEPIVAKPIEPILPVVPMVPEVASPEQVVAIDAADVGSDVKHDDLAPVELANDDPVEKKIRVPIVKKSVVPKVENTTRTTTDKPIVKPDEKKGILLIAP